MHSPAVHGPLDASKARPSPRSHRDGSISIDFAAVRSTHGLNFDRLLVLLLCVLQCPPALFLLPSRPTIRRLSRSSPHLLPALFFFSNPIYTSRYPTRHPTNLLPPQARPRRRRRVDLGRFGGRRLVAPGQEGGDGGAVRVREGELHCELFGTKGRVSPTLIIDDNPPTTKQDKTCPPSLA